jgi:hypothetical protein
MHYASLIDILVGNAELPRVQHNGIPAIVVSQTQIENG